MKCPKCQFENRRFGKFCLKCGESLNYKCPHCGVNLPPSSEYCDSCGIKINICIQSEKPKWPPINEGERKHVTVLFTDISGYTRLSEKLDPEDVKEITTYIFGETAKIIDRYEGFIEKFVGDAIMAIFGVPESHEDDPLRAIRAAMEIHKLVQQLPSRLERKIEQALCMHTGIYTGLVVTGDVNMKTGVHGVTGDTINLAARLSSKATDNQILVGHKTHIRTQGYVEFERLEPMTVKGKEEPINAFKVVALKKEPESVHRLSGLKADLIGRKAELSELTEAIRLLNFGKGTIFSIVGEAGAGKSRLIQEFKGSLDEAATRRKIIS